MQNSVLIRLEACFEMRDEASSKLARFQLRDVAVPLSQMAERRPLSRAAPSSSGRPQAILCWGFCPS
jgi:hypothetical protein